MKWAVAGRLTPKTRWTLQMSPLFLRCGPVLTPRHSPSRHSTESSNTWVTHRLKMEAGMPQVRSAPSHKRGTWEGSRAPTALHPFCAPGSMQSYAWTGTQQERVRTIRGVAWQKRVQLKDREPPPVASPLKLVREGREKAD